MYFSTVTMSFVHDAWQVETVGDCYVVAGGLMQKDEDGFSTVVPHDTCTHVRDLFGFAKALKAAAHHVRMPHNEQPVRLRVGLHTGPIVSGGVGTRMPKFCL